MPQFDRDSARQIARATRDRLRAPRSDYPARTMMPSLTGTPTYFYVTQQVGIMVGTKMGKGKGVKYSLTYDASDDATLDFPAVDSLWIYSGAKATGAEIGIGRMVLCIPVGGRWHVIADFCTS